MSRAIVIGGGGARIGFPAGVLSYLQAKGNFPDLVVGTSAGALAAAAIGSVGPQKLIQALGKIRSWRDLYKVNYSALTGFGDGILSTEPLHDMLHSLIDTSVKRCKVFVTKTSLETGQTIYGTNDDQDYLESVEASTAIPFVVRPVNGFVDGGVCCNVPIGRALASGATDITVIMCSPYHKGGIDPWKPSWKWLSGVEVSFRALDIMEDEMMRHQIAMARTAGAKLTIFSPPTEFCGTLDFSQENMDKGIRLGLNAQPIT